MGKRREVQQRLTSIHEIDGIMVAMKNLALLETHRLAGFIDTQRRAVKSIEAVAADFLAFYPQAAAPGDGMQQMLLLVIGSERGLCGDFNETLFGPLAAARQQSDMLMVAVGSRLEAKLHDDAGIFAFVEGPSVVEEVEARCWTICSSSGRARCGASMRYTTTTKKPNPGCASFCRWPSRLEHQLTRMRLCSIWNRRDSCPSLPTSICTPRCMKCFTRR
jgi:hypothetical protein